MTDATNSGAAPAAATPTAPEKGTPEYNQQMANRYNQQFGNLHPEGQTPGQSKDETKAQITPKPEGGHDKFYDAKTGVYNWEAHAREVEFRDAQKNGKKPDEKKGDEAATEEKPEGTPEGQPEVTESSAEAMLTKAGLNPETMRDALLRDGKLSDTDYKASVAIFGQAMVDDYISGVNAAKELAVYKTQEYVGGKENYDAIKAFGESLPQAEKDEYNAMLRSPNWKIAIDALRARMGSNKKTAGEPSLIDGGDAAAGDVGFATQADMVKAMRDPRYNPMSPQFDREYAKSVHAKVGKAGFRRR